MNAKVLSAFVIAAFVMLAIPVVAFSDSDSSDAVSSTSYGSFNFWITDDANDWGTSISGDGYNAAIALKAALGNDVVLDENYTVLIPSPWGDYYDINTEYGTVSSIDGYDTTGNSWYVYYYSPQTGWNNALDALGFYKPFDDYDAQFQTANITLYYGAAPISARAVDIDSGFENIVHVPQTSYETNAADFAVTFHFYINDNAVNNHLGSPSADIIQNLQNGITLTGYGSDAYTAFKNISYYDFSSTSKGDIAINGAITTGYGSVQDIFGLLYGNVGAWPDPATYYYWSLYEGDFGNYAGFLLGYYTPLVNSPGSGFTMDEFTFEYYVSVM